MKKTNLELIKKFYTPISFVTKKIFKKTKSEANFIFRGESLKTDADKITNSATNFIWCCDYSSAKKNRKNIR